MNPDQNGSPSGDPIPCRAPNRPPPWFRTYRSDLDCPAIQMLEPAALRTLVNLRCIADHMTGDIPDLKTIAFRLRLSLDEAVHHISVLTTADLIVDGRLAGWSQAEADFSAKRTRDYRQRRKNASDNACDVTRDTLSDASVTNNKKQASSVSAATSRRTRLAKDVQPDQQDRDAATKAFLTDAEFRSEWEAYRDHHSGKGTMMADWHAAWRTWLRNRETFGRGRQKTTSRSSLSPFTAAAADLIRTRHEHSDHDRFADFDADAYAAHGLQRLEESSERDGDKGTGPLLNLRAQRSVHADAVGDGNTSYAH